VRESLEDRAVVLELRFGCEGLAFRELSAFGALSFALSSSDALRCFAGTDVHAAVQSELGIPSVGLCDGGGGITSVPTAEYV